MQLTELMRRMGESIEGGRSFGPAFEHDGVLVIPVAYVFGGGGGGEGQPASKPGEPVPPPGVGGGFGMVSWPIGVYVVKGGEVRFRPVVDVGAMILLTRSVVRGLRRSGRRRRRRRALRG